MGMRHRPLITKTEQAGGMPINEAAPDTVHRLPGSYRNDAILAFEAEFDTFVLPTMEWGAWDTFFHHDGHIYYYKPHLQTLIDTNISERESGPEFDAFVAGVQELIPEFTGQQFNPQSLADIRAIIDQAPPGMPKFVCETPHFYQFEDVGATAMGIDDISRALLDKIESTFTTYLPSPFTRYDALYVKDGEVYWTDLVRWVPKYPSELSNIGICLDTEGTRKFPAGAYFFAFGSELGRSEKAAKLIDHFKL
jgi:hypothetical protein